MYEITDEDLMYRAKNGDMKCISVLFERYNVRLYNFFYQQTRDKIQSEDLTQNVFERLIKYRHQYKAEGKFISWIFSIARNVHIDLYRKQTPDLPGDEKVMSLANQEDEPYSEENFHSTRLKLAMNALSGEERQLIYWSRFEKMKYADMAKMLDTSEGAIKTKMHRTMKNLKQAFFKIQINE